MKGKIMRIFILLSVVLSVASCGVPLVPFV